MENCYIRFKTKQKIEKLEIEDLIQLEESFYKNLEFGTGREV